MSEDKVIMLDQYRAARPAPRPFSAEFGSLRGWISALWPSALFLAFLFAGQYLIGGIAYQILCAVIAAAMIAWAIWGIVRPGAEEWVDPAVAAAHRRNTRHWSIVSLLLWILIASYTIFTLIFPE